DRSTTGDDPPQHDDDRYDEQQVNQAARHVEREKAQRPQDQQNDGKGEQHGQALLVVMVDAPGRSCSVGPPCSWRPSMIRAASTSCPTSIMRMARSPMPHSAPARTMSRLASPSSVAIASRPCVVNPVTISATSSSNRMM